MIPRLGPCSGAGGKLQVQGSAPLRSFLRQVSAHCDRTPGKGTSRLSYGQLSHGANREQLFNTPSGPRGSCLSQRPCPREASTLSPASFCNDESHPLPPPAHSEVWWPTVPRGFGVAGGSSRKTNLSPTQGSLEWEWQIKYSISNKP